MKNSFKNASIYLLFMVLIAGLIFTASHFYGQKVKEDLTAEINQFAQNNGYQLEELEVETNLLLKEFNLKKLKISQRNNFNLTLNEAVINFSWQQLLNYFQNGEFEIDKNLDSQITELDYSNLKQNYQLKMEETELNYQGDLPAAELSQINDFNDLALILDDNHDLDFKAKKIKFDFPYYRYYGLSREVWDQLSTFNNFILKADYNKEDELFNLSQFNLTNNFLKIVFNLETLLASDLERNKVEVEDLKSSYDLLLAAENLKFKENDYFQDLNLKQLDLSGNFELERVEKLLKIKEFDFALNLADFELKLSPAMTAKVAQNTFDILGNEDNFSFTINQFSYDQEYIYPNGKSRSQLESSLLAAEIETDYNYSQEIPYLNNAKIKYKSKNPQIEQLSLFIQLVLGKQFKKTEAGYYQIDIWGPLNDLNFE